MSLLVPIDLLDPSPDNPREHLGVTTLHELAASIEAQGILEPLVVEPAGDRFLVVAGHRRLAAARIAGLAAVPVEVSEPRPRVDRLAAMVVENVQRKQLTGREKALAYRRMIDEFGLSQVEVARRVGLHPSTISNALQLLKPRRQRAEERTERARRRAAGEAVPGRPVEESPGECLRRLRESADDGRSAYLTPTQCRIILAMLQRAASAVREARVAAAA